MVFHRKCEHFVDFLGFKTKTKEMSWFPMSFSLRFWVCSSFHAQNETWVVKKQNSCDETEQNVPMNFVWKRAQNNLQALEKRDQATHFPPLSQGSHTGLWPWKWTVPLNPCAPTSPIFSLCSCHRQSAFWEFCKLCSQIWVPVYEWLDVEKSAPQISKNLQFSHQ